MAEKEAWYHHSISRKEAEQKLYHSEKDGAFLVRKSDTVPGAYVLSLHVDRFIHHYRIRLDTGGFYVTVNSRTNLNSMKFESLFSVINYLMQNPNKINLAGPLLHPISPEKEEEDFYEEESTTEDEDDMSSDDEQDETIKQCPSELRLSLKKRASTHHSGNRTLRIFQDVFESLDTTALDEADPSFIALIRRYVQTSAFWDIQKDDSGGTGCLERLVDYSCRDLLTQLRLFNQKMEFLDKLVSGIAKGNLLEASLREEGVPVKEELLDSIDPALMECSRVSSRMNNKINSVFRHLSRSIQVSEECLINDTKTFEAKEEGLRGGKIQLSVDPRRGIISFGKSGQYFHQQIKRLEKNYKDPNKMTMIFMDKKKRDIVFDDTRTREEFFQTVSQIKHIHKSEKDVKNVSVFCCTWNMGEVEPVNDIIHLFDDAGDHISGFSNQGKTAHDIYAIGSQEANITEKDWVNLIKRALSHRHPAVQYNLVGSQTLAGIRIVVLVKSDHINKISNPEYSVVKTGVGGMVGNKGAVAVSFAFGSTNMAFVSCHLAARAERKLKRNQMYQDISRQLNLGKKSKFSSFDLPLRFDHLFWMGDLNYRLDCEYREVLERIKVSDFTGLMKYDQLKSQQTHGNVFYDFKEGEINFPPSYRYKRGSRDDYVYIKYKTTGNVHNVPSYCDRVLLHSLPQLKQHQTGYFCNLAYKASDHAPVIATYQVSTRLQYVSSKNTDTENESDDSLKIRFPILQAKIKTNSPDRFCVKFFSYLLEGTPTSKPAPRVLAEYDDELSGFPVQYGLSKCDVSYWGMGDIPELEPILPNRDYISNDYIFIQVVSHGSEECYGQGILTMQDKVKSDTVQPFSVLLRLHDEVCGELRGKVCLSRNPVLESRSLFSDQLVNPDWSSSMQPSARNLASPGGRSSGSSSSPRSQHWSNEYNDDVAMRGFSQGYSHS